MPQNNPRYQRVLDQALFFIKSDNFHLLQKRHLLAIEVLLKEAGADYDNGYRDIFRAEPPK